MRKNITFFLIYIFTLVALASLPPTTTRVSGEASDVVTFGINFGAIPATRSGTAMALGTIPIAAGGTGATAKNFVDLTSSQSVAGYKSFSDNMAVGTSSVATYTLSVFLPGDNGALFDGRATQRSLPLSVVDIKNTPAVTGSRALELNVDINGYSDTHALVSNYTLTGLTAGGHANNFLINYDTANSSGGFADALSVEKAGVGSASITALHASSEINVIRQTQGATVTPLQGWNYNNPTYTNLNSYFISSTSNYTIFNTTSDVLFVGHGSTFSGIEVVLATGANTSLLPTFEFWNGSAWTTFSPIDGTAGFQSSGNISWTISNLSGWASTTVNAVAGYYVRITRTKGSVSIKPIESLIKVSQGNTYYWDADGDISSNTLTVGGQITSTVSTGTAPMIIASTTKVSNLYVDRAATADVVTTNANLTGAVTSVGNATSLGSFTSANLSTALTDESGTGAAIFADSPVFTTQLTSPVVVGGTSTTQSLVYKTTTGAGTTGADHIFQTGNNGATEAMRILNSGIVGIGTPTPEGQLHVRGTSANYFDRYGGTASHLVGRSARGTSASPSTTLSGDTIAIFSGAGYDGTSFGTQTSGSMRVVATENLTPTARGTAVQIWTTPNTMITPQERVRIDHNGNVGVGTTSPAASAIMDLTSTTKAFLPTRMTTTQKNAIAPATTGMMVFDTTLNVMSKYNGTGWADDGTVAAGGTGLTTVAPGEILYADATNSLARLTNASGGQFLKSNGGASAPSWAIPAGTIVAASKNVNYVLSSVDQIAYFDISAGSLIATLPTATGNVGQSFTITVATASTNTYTLTLATTASQSVGAYSYGDIKMGSAYDNITVFSDGQNWHIKDMNITVAASYFLTSGFAATTAVPININSKEYDTHNAVTPHATAWKFTAPMSGIYAITWFGSQNTSTAIDMYKNGVNYKRVSYGGASFGIPGASTIKLNKGEYIDFRPDANITFTGNATMIGQEVKMSIFKVR